jgi:hypothetical protein
MAALTEFEVTLTFCFTPEHCGVVPHHTSPPLDHLEYAEFCESMVERYAPAITGSTSDARLQAVHTFAGFP